MKTIRYKFPSRSEYERQQREKRRIEVTRWAFGVCFTVLGFYAVMAAIGVIL